mmetsp:Transcript_2752/g.4478  ORF Transcript_2752/g.4478 Transcript_2752/m.4478 type:complete len:111 (-) Transcript_2752:871-1203(-)
MCPNKKVQSGSKLHLPNPSNTCASFLKFPGPTFQNLRSAPTSSIPDLLALCIRGQGFFANNGCARLEDERYSVRLIDMNGDQERAAHNEVRRNKKANGALRGYNTFNTSN